MSVKPTTQFFLRCVASDMAPNTGTERRTRADETLLATAAIVFEVPISFTSHTAKNKVAMFIEKIVLEKS
jgi:hypothetical protein